MKSLHAWDLTPEEAIDLQKELRARLDLTWDKHRHISTVGGVASSFPSEPGDVARWAMAVFHFPELTPIEAAIIDVPLVFPYIPGLLSFREGPAVLAAWDKLTATPNLLMFDGQGIATQIGLWLERPTIGVAKSRLYGKHQEVDLNQTRRPR